MNEDEKATIYNKGYKAGEEHSEPSPKTLSLIENMQTEFRYLKESVKEIKETIKDLPTKASMELANRNIVEEVFQKVQECYVSKEEFSPVKKVVYGVVTIVLVAVCSAVVYLVVAH